MGILTIILPDIGEGIAEAEITEWNIAIGDIIKEDDILGVVMTDKAAVEVPAIVSGKIISLGGEVGEFIAIGATFVTLEILGEENETKNDEQVEQSSVVPQNQSIVSQHSTKEKVKAAPSVRKRALNANIDLQQLVGTGPNERITQYDLDNFLAGSSHFQKNTQTENKHIKQIKITGMRRIIAEKMSLSKSKIPHITIIEEINVDMLEVLRARLNKQYADQRIKLTPLAFIMRAIVRAVAMYPQINAIFDDEGEVIYQHKNVHLGIATQTSAGLSVPVVKNAQTLNIWDCAKQMSHLANLAKKGKATRDELSGSTITISSLGHLGAIATTPIINHPEVAIVGVNKIAIRPMWDGQQFLPKKMMNISCSFDHRVIDGFDAAQFVQELKSLLEAPNGLI
ncbi:MAG: 2-oxo acid dehydrogenase subunit E2 [Devosiaceae bacterium]|nr:2-oxo acid dehydrogenase subunit E2 [Devosiaceae bacterium]